MTDFLVVALPREKWKGTVVPLSTNNDSFYDLSISDDGNSGATIKFVKKKAESEIVHTAEELNYPVSLYQDRWSESDAFGVVGDNNELLACIEFAPQEWTNRLLVTTLWVSEQLQNKGVGKRLLDKAKEVASKRKYRAILVEVQSYNAKAIGFYLHENFKLIGFDTCCYTNNDVERREFKISLGYFVV